MAFFMSLRKDKMLIPKSYLCGNKDFVLIDDVAKVIVDFYYLNSENVNYDFWKYDADNYRFDILYRDTTKFPAIYLVAGFQVFEEAGKLYTSRAYLDKQEVKKGWPVREFCKNSTIESPLSRKVLKCHNKNYVIIDEVAKVIADFYNLIPAKITYDYWKVDDEVCRFDILHEFSTTNSTPSLIAGFGVIEEFGKLYVSRAYLDRQEIKKGWPVRKYCTNTMMESPLSEMVLNGKGALPLSP